MRTINRRTAVRVALVGLAFGVSAATCDASIGDAAVVVDADEVVWNANTPIESHAVITQANGNPIPSNYMVTARVEWAMPGGQQALHQELDVIADSATEFSVMATGQLAESARVGDLRWLVEGTNDNLLGEANRRFQVDCPDGPDAELASMQEEVLDRFGDFTTLQEIEDEGWAENTHGNINIRGIGISFINPQIELVADTPSLIMFIESGDDADPTNTALDEPLQLVGWGYPAPQVFEERPTFGCVPYHEWFLHAAGWHTPEDGGMVVDPGVENVEEYPAALQAAEAGGGLLAYHPQVWDLHLWADESGVPRVTIWNDPGGARIPSTGFDALDDTIFFYP